MFGSERPVHTLAHRGWRARAYAASSALQQTRLGATRSVRRSRIVRLLGAGAVSCKLDQSHCHIRTAVRRMPLHCSERVDSSRF